MGFKTMTDQKQVLFIHGGGEDGYGADSKLAESLRTALGAGYDVHYPKMPDDQENLPDFGWGAQIDKELAAIHDPVILVGHSVGASILLKYLSENAITHPISGLFLIAAPFWGGDRKWQYESLTLREQFADRLPKGVPIFLYQCRDDEEDNITHLTLYARKIPWATVHELASGGHQLGNDLTPVARDIQGLS
jgi:predicted alpha/beta hydrolase family esterase